MFSSDDTIVAIATPSGRGGIGVVRVSGPNATDIAAQILTRQPALVPRHATLTRVRLKQRRRGPCRRPRNRDVVPRSSFLHRGTRRRDQHPRKPGRAQRHTEQPHRCWRSAGETGRVHLQSIPERTNRSRAGGGGCGSDRGSDPASGADGVRSIGGYVKRSHRCARSAGCSI